MVAIKMGHGIEKEEQLPKNLLPQGRCGVLKFALCSVLFMFLVFGGLVWTVNQPHLCQNIRILTSDITKRLPLGKMETNVNIRPIEEPEDGHIVCNWNNDAAFVGDGQFGNQDQAIVVGNGIFWSGNGGCFKGNGIFVEGDNNWICGYGNTAIGTGNIVKQHCHFGGSVGSPNVKNCLELGGRTSKCVIDGMLNVIYKHIAWDDWEAWYGVMKDFWTEDMIYDSNWTPNGDFSNNTGLREWFDHEHLPFNLAFDNTTFSTIIWIGEEFTASSISYGKATWIGDLGTIPGRQLSGQEVTIWDLDFYRMNDSGEKIAYNWCLIDFVDLMRQVGYQVLPKPALKEGFMLPPAAMDGIPAPISRLIDPLQSALSKVIIQALLMDDFVDGSSPSSLWTGDMVWYGGAGFGMAKGVEEYETHFLAPLREGLSQRKLSLDVITCEGVYCGAHGYIEAVHSGVWLGEQPTNIPVRVRLALHWRVDLSTGLVPECWAMFDLPAAFNMLGINLFDRMTQQYRIKQV